MGILWQNCLQEIIGIFLMCHNTTLRVYGVWFKIYFVLCSKTYSTSHNVLQSTASSRHAARSARICETRLFLWMLYTSRFSTSELRPLVDCVKAFKEYEDSQGPEVVQGQCPDPEVPVKLLEILLRRCQSGRTWWRHNMTDVLRNSSPLWGDW